MTVFSYAKMMFSSHGGWDDVERTHPSVTTMYLFLVLPMSLIPPAMIIYAGLNYGSDFFAVATETTWVISSVVFLVAELLTVPVMASAMKSVAETRAIKTEYRDTFAVASIAAVPCGFRPLPCSCPALCS